MKKLWITGIILVVLAAMVCLAGCGTSSYSEVDRIFSNQQEGIWVNGTGKVSVTPDVVNVNLGIESRGTSVAEAQEKAIQAMDDVMQALKSFNIEDKDIKTQQYNISPLYAYDEPTKTNVITGYQVTNIVNVKIRDTGKAGEIIDAVALAGGDMTRINSISFSVEDPTQYYEEARTRAMEDANNKAKQLAELGGVTLGKPTYITDSSYSPITVYDTRNLLGAKEASSTQISTGEMDITVTVQVTYSILK